jgi:hypothetical protein
MWDLWWTKWHWDRFFSEYFGFPLSISFHRCPIKMEKQKRTSSSSSSSQVCTISLQGSGASVASAVGPFNKIKKQHVWLTHISALPKTDAEFFILIVTFRL